MNGYSAEDGDPKGMVTVAGFLNIQGLLIVPEMSIVLGMVTAWECDSLKDGDNPSYGDHPRDCDTPKIWLATLHHVAWPKIMSTKPLYI